MVLNEKLKLLSVYECVKSLRTITVDWRHKTPYQKWCNFYSFGRASFKPVGIPLFEDDQTIHWYSHSVYVSIGVPLALGIYTAVYYVSHCQPEKFIPCSCMLSLTLCYLPFLRSVLSKNRYKYHSLVDFSGRYIYPDDHERTEYNRICSEEMDDTVKRFIIKMGLMMIGAICAVWGTIYVYFSEGIKTTTLELKVPFTDEKSNVEYTVNMILQWEVFCYGFCLYFGMEIAMSIFGNVVTVTPKLIRSRLKELDEMVEWNELSEPQLRFASQDITKQILDYEKYVIELRELLAVRTLITPALFTYSIGMSIFCQYSEDFVAGYGLALMSWIQFFYICEVGEQVENNRLDLIIYDIKWYHFPKELQKNLLQLINQQQNKTVLTVGPFGNVNRELFKVVTKKIYSLVMFLHSCGA